MSFRTCRKCARRVIKCSFILDNLSLVISDCNYYGHNSGMFTHVSDAHDTTSWLDHVLCSQDMQTKLHSIAILDMLPSSDHVPLSFVFDF